MIDIFSECQINGIHKYS